MSSTANNASRNPGGASSSYCYLAVETNGQGKPCATDKDCKQILKQYCEREDYKYGNLPYKCEASQCVFQTTKKTL